MYEIIALLIILVLLLVAAGAGVVLYLVVTSGLTIVNGLTTELLNGK